MSGRGFGCCLLLVLAVLLVAERAPATDPATPKLRWGGDKGGGAPYIFEDKDGKLTGFEVRLAEYLAGKLGRTSEFVQKEWDGLPQNLERKDVDLVLNGYEWSPEREEQMASTIPYYIYKLQLIARQDDSSIRGWEDLRAKQGQGKKRVGVLSASAAHDYLKDKFGDDVEIVALGEEGTTGIMLSVQQGNLDATVQDLPAAVYYVGPGREFPKLRLVGDPVAPGYYVIFVRKEDETLRAELNQALREAIQDGTLKKIYEPYRLWNKDQEKLAKLMDDWPPNVAVVRKSSWEYLWTLTQAAWTTVLLSFLSMPLAILIGLLVAVGRLYGPRWLGWLLAVYVEVLRGTPLLLQLSVIYFVLPKAGIYLHPFWAGVMGLAVNYSAYEAENYRAGFLAIPRGQMEAALSLGMSTPTALYRIIVPQAVRIVIPPVTNDFIALFKDTSVCSVIAVTELTARSRHLMVNNPHMWVELALMTALLYLLMSYPLSLVARRLERSFPRVTV